MTQELLRFESYVFPPVDDASVDTVPPTLPRFNLKKRTIGGDEREDMHPPTVNSAFLSGLFAEDVTKVQENCSASPIQDSDPRLDFSKPSKKTKLTKTKAMTRCGKSFKILSEAETEAETTETMLKTPTAIYIDYFLPSFDAPNSIERDDSFQYQLNCVTESSSTDVIGVSQAVTLEFPLLTTNWPSDRVCLLACKVSELQMHEEDDAPKESYGWFVEIDNNVPSVTEHPYVSTSSRDLAFFAPTAPEAANYDAEVEWARAADTVDDVLGDFF
jgi:hypothetical protein